MLPGMLHGPYDSTGLFSMIDELRIESIRNLPHNKDGQGNDFLCI